MDDTLQHRARELRTTQTDAEQRLWRSLRNRQLEGYKFRRQRPIGPYIADFICLDAKLIVEVDGGQHAEQIGYDAARTAFFEEQGYRVLRFWNTEVLTETEAVLESIRLALLDSPSP